MITEKLTDEICNVLGYYTDDLREEIKKITVLIYAAGFDEGRGCHAKRKRVTQLTKDGKIIRVWNSITMAETALGKRSGAITSVLNGKCKTCAGYKWILTDK